MPKPSKSSAPITVRLPNEIVQAVNEEAEALQMSRSEVVTRRLKRTFSAVSEVRKMSENDRNSNDALPELAEEND